MKAISTFIIILFPILALLSGCGGTPTLQTLNVNLQCEDDCNESNPIKVRIFQLKDAEKFRNADFNTLNENPEDELESDLVPNSKFEKIMNPGETITMDNVQLRQGAMYIGVVGDFETPDAGGWKTVIPINKDLVKLSIKIEEKILTYTIN